MYVACIYDPRSLTLMHVCMMHIPMILDPDACVYDACMKDAYIHDPWPWCMYLWCGIFSGPTNGRTDEQGDSRRRIDKQLPRTMIHKLSNMKSLNFGSFFSSTTSSSDVGLTSWGALTFLIMAISFQYMPWMRCHRCTFWPILYILCSKFSNIFKGFPWSPARAWPLILP